jgi:hypothetical protein
MTKSLIETMGDFCAKPEIAERAAFEAAMVDRIAAEGYRFADLFWEIYLCQRMIASLQMRLEELQEKPKGKKA